MRLMPIITFTTLLGFPIMWSDMPVTAGKGTGRFSRTNLTKRSAKPNVFENGHPSSNGEIYFYYYPILENKSAYQFVLLDDMGQLQSNLLDKQDGDDSEEETGNEGDDEDKDEDDDDGKFGSELKDEFEDIKDELTDVLNEFDPYLLSILWVILLRYFIVGLKLRDPKHLGNTLTLAGEAVGYMILADGLENNDTAAEMGGTAIGWVCGVGGLILDLEGIISGGRCIGRHEDARKCRQAGDPCVPLEVDCNGNEALGEIITSTLAIGLSIVAAICTPCIPSLFLVEILSAYANDLIQPYVPEKSFENFLKFLEEYENLIEKGEAILQFGNQGYIPLPEKLGLNFKGQ